MDQFGYFNPLYLGLWVEIQKSPRWRHLYAPHGLPAQKLAQLPQPFGLQGGGARGATGFRCSCSCNSYLSVSFKFLQSTSNYLASYGYEGHYDLSIFTIPCLCNPQKKPNCVELNARFFFFCYGIRKMKHQMSELLKMHKSHYNSKSESESVNVRVSV